MAKRVKDKTAEKKAAKTKTRARARAKATGPAGAGIVRRFRLDELRHHCRSEVRFLRPVETRAERPEPVAVQWITRPAA